MPNLLDFFARTHTPYLHARGWRGTAALFSLLQAQPGQRILELGFGTGQTLVDLQAHCPGLELFGVEKSPLMLAAARRRLRFCRFRQITVSLYRDQLPFPDGFFDAVYAESVLAIVPDDNLPALFAELHRVIRPGGRLCCNESLWRPDISLATIRDINARCVQLFGMVQAPEQYPYPADWRNLGIETGFRVETSQSLEEVSPALRMPERQLCAVLFSMLGRIKGRLLPRLIREKRLWQKGEQTFQEYGRFLEGWLFAFRK